MAREKLGKVLECKLCGIERYCPLSEIKKHKREYCKACWYKSKKFKRLANYLVKNYTKNLLTPAQSSKRLKKLHEDLRRKDPEGYRNLQRQRFVKWKEEKPKDYFKHQRDAGKLGGKLGLKRALELHPDLHLIAAKAFQKKYPNHMKEVQERWKKADPEGYKQHHSKIGKLAHKLHPNLGHENGLKAIKIQRENKPYWLDGVPYDSSSEREIAKKFIERGIVKKFIRGKNCHIPIRGKSGSIEVDFLIGKTFVEFHPVVSYYEKKETSVEYYNRKRKILNEAGFKNNKLILFDKVNDFEKVVFPNIMQA